MEKKTPGIVRSYGFECDFKNVLSCPDVISKRLFQEGFGSIVALQPLRENDGWCSADQRRGLFFVVTRGKGELIEKTNEGCQLSRTGLVHIRIRTYAYTYKSKTLLYCLFLSIGLFFLNRSKQHFSQCV